MLPYPDMNFTAFDILTAEEMNQIVANVEALSDGSGLEPGAVKAGNTDFGGDYSTSEVNTGFKWVDGKDIYKKTISIGALPNATVKNVAHGVDDIETVVACSGWSRQSAGGTHLTLPYANPTSSAAVALYAGSTNVSIETGSNRTAFVDTYATIWYTKT